MGNDPSTQRNNSSNPSSSMGSRQVSLAGAAGGGMGRRATSSFSNFGNNDDDNFNENGTNDNSELTSRLRGVDNDPETRTRQRKFFSRLFGSRAGNESGPNEADLFETPRTVFLEFSHTTDKNEHKSRWEVLGRVEIELFSEVRKCAENFYFMCTGEKKDELDNPHLHYKDTIAHRIIPKFMLQAGDTEKQNGTGCLSIYGDDEKVETEYPGRAATHFPYCVSQANAGHGSKFGSQFFIVSGSCKADWLNGKHQVFGKVVSGEAIVDIVESYGSTTGKTQGFIFISDCGETEESKKLRANLEQKSNKNEGRSKALAAAQAAVRVETATQQQQQQQQSEKTKEKETGENYRTSLPPAQQMPTPSLGVLNSFVYIDFMSFSKNNNSHQASPLGRVIIELFDMALPRTCLNFKLLLNGTESRNGKRLAYRNNAVHRIIKNFCVQFGDVVKGDGTSGHSALAVHEKSNSPFFDDEGYLPHFTGCLATATSGKNKNNSQCYILTAPTANCSHLDGRDVVFGRVVDGWRFIKMMEEREKSMKFVISSCGELKGSDIPTSLDGLDLPTDAVSAPKEAYAFWCNHPQTSSAPITNRKSTTGTTRTAKTDDDDTAGTVASSTPTPNAPNGVIHPPFVRAFNNGVLPPEMQAFVQDFLRIIECPVCLANFDNYSRIPCTLACGHSICFNHLHLLEHCPLCRQEITGRTKIQPNIVLKELCAKFAPTDKESIELSQKPKPRAVTPKSRRSGLLSSLQDQVDFNAPAQSNRATTPPRVVTAAATATAPNSRSRTLVLSANRPTNPRPAEVDPFLELTTLAPRRSTNTSLPSSNDRTTSSAAANTGQRTNHQPTHLTRPGQTTHKCPRGCDTARSQRKCCSCMDSRPMRREFTYTQYVDGQGHVDSAPRWKYYCPICVSACEKNYYATQ